MKRQNLHLWSIWFGVLLALCAGTAPGVTIGELVRLKGHENNLLTGMGIVIGLNGTGDTTKSSLAAARPYAALLSNLGNPVMSIDELREADSYAIVEVTMRIPPRGVREGDRLDVTVHTLFNAESLAGGTLFVSPLRLPRPDTPGLSVMAIAEGPVVIEGGVAGNPRSGVIRAGGQMLTDIRTSVVSPDGRMELVLKGQYAGYRMASTIAEWINDHYERQYTKLAYVEDAKNITISLPREELKNPASFIADILSIRSDASLIQTEARIIINEKNGTIVITGNVEISPVGITHEGLTITTISSDPQAPGSGAGGGAGVSTGGWAGLDTSDRTGRSSTRLLELLKAFDQLSVPVRDQIAIIHELKRSGALHAEIITQ